jgi:hypothetical protein
MSQFAADYEHPLRSAKRPIRCLEAVRDGFCETAARRPGPRRRYVAKAASSRRVSPGSGATWQMSPRASHPARMVYLTNLGRDHLR